MKTINLHQVDAFTDTKFGGNPAGVVTNADELTSDEMLKIAREMNLSETAFVLPPAAHDADVKLRYFSPTTEIAFCGHATVATLFQLSQLDMFGLGKPGKNTVRVETGAGVLEMSVTREQSGRPRVTFAAPPVELETHPLQGKAFANAFGIAASALHPEGSILIDRKLNYVYVPVSSLETLGKLTFDFDTIRTNFEQEKIVVFCLFTAETYDNASDLHARVTGPLVGINEDPFTGSTQAGMIHSAKKLGLLDAQKDVIRTEQGHFVGRPGFAEVHHDNKTNEIAVVANAASVFSTTMEI